MEIDDCNPPPPRVLMLHCDVESSLVCVCVCVCCFPYRLSQFLFGRLLMISDEGMDSVRYCNGPLNQARSDFLSDLNAYCAGLSIAVVAEHFTLSQSRIFFVF